LDRKRSDRFSDIDSFVVANGHQKRRRPKAGWAWSQDWVSLAGSLPVTDQTQAAVEEAVPLSATGARISLLSQRGRVNKLYTLRCRNTMSAGID
jgi:hypothetical protein